MEKKDPNKVPHNLVQLELHPPLKAADFKSGPHPTHESVEALASRRVIETSSYRTTPCHIPPPEELSCPEQSPGNEIPFLADEIPLGPPNEE